MILALFGSAGSGKTTLGRALAAHLDAPLLGPDDYRGPYHLRWPPLLRAITDSDRCIVESCAMPRLYAQLLAHRCVCTVLVETAERERGRRLVARAWTARRIATTIGYVCPCIPDVVVDGSAEPSIGVARITQHLATIPNAQHSSQAEL